LITELPTPEIKIKAQAKHHAYSLMLLGLLSLALITLLAQHYWLEAKLVLIFLVLVSLVVIFIGFIKRLEPETSFLITPQWIRYLHKYGVWQIAWPDIARIAQVTETTFLERIELPYVGIKLNSLNAIVANISPRLASRLIHEQRPLIHFCLQHRLLTMDQVIINFTPFKLEGKTIKGPVAAFLHQTTILQQALGYHLYIPESAVDRPCQAFVTLLNNCQRNADRYTSPETEA
jgi:hypothetical protein